MRLKQWRVPSVLKLECLWTKSCTPATEFSVATLSVLYSMLPAQLESFSGAAKEFISKGMAAAAVQSLMKVRFFMDGNYRGWGKEYNGNVSDRVGFVVRAHTVKAARGCGIPNGPALYSLS